MSAARSAQQPPQRPLFMFSAARGNDTSTAYKIFSHKIFRDDLHDAGCEGAQP